MTVALLFLNGKPWLRLPEDYRRASGRRFSSDVDEGRYGIGPESVVSLVPSPRSPTAQALAADAPAAHQQMMRVRDQEKLNGH